MTRGGNRCDKTPARYRYLELLIAFAKEHNGSTPTHYGWWQLVKEAGHNLSWSSFRSHTWKLADEELVVFVDGVVCIRHGDWKLLDKEGNVLRTGTGEALDTPEARAQLEESRREHRERTAIRKELSLRLRSGGDSHISPQDIERMLEMQGYRCWWCGKRLRDEYHLDHRIPLARGGTNEIGNLCASCPSCNLSKGAKMPWEFCGRLV